MTIISGFFILLLSMLLALSSSMAAAGHHRHLKTPDTVYLKSSTNTLPFPFSVYNVTWDFNVKDWFRDSNITFHAGDMLVFNYDQDLHNVVPVDEANYQSCSIPEVAAVYNSGHDSIVLGPGSNYFICGTMGHCVAGMLLNVTANSIEFAGNII